MFLPPPLAPLFSTKQTETRELGGRQGQRWNPAPDAPSMQTHPPELCWGPLSSLCFEASAGGRFPKEEKVERALCTPPTTPSSQWGPPSTAGHAPHGPRLRGVGAHAEPAGNSLPRGVLPPVCRSPVETGTPGHILEF